MPMFRKGSRKQTADNAKALFEACRQHPPPVDVITNILTVDPGAARVRDEYGNNLLHIVCAKRNVSAVIVQALIRAWPDATRQANPRDGSLPLHLAAASHAEPEVLSALITSNPSAVKMVDKQGNLPLHEACTQKAPFECVLMLLQAWPEAVERANFDDESLPLHAACTVTPATFDSPNEMSFEVIWSLLETWPDAVMSRDHNGETPYDLLKRGAPRQTELLKLMRNKRAIAQMPAGERQRHLERERRKDAFKTTVKRSTDAPAASGPVDLDSVASTSSNTSSSWDQASQAHSAADFARDHSEELSVGSSPHSVVSMSKADKKKNRKERRQRRKQLRAEAPVEV